MTAVASSPVQTPAAITIPENSTCMKCLSYIPIFGIFASWTQELSLASKLQNEKRMDHAVQLLEVKNAYKSINVVRNLLIIAVIVAQVALGWISVTLGMIWASLFMCSISTAVRARSHNESLIKEIKANGIPANPLFA